MIPRKRLFLLSSLFLWLLIEFMVGKQYAALHNRGDEKYYRWDTQTLWALRPGIDTELHGNSYHTNAQGFRGTNSYSYNKTHDLRILVLGDSRTYGMNVSDRYTYSNVLQAELQNRNIDAEVINTGTPGYSIVQCRAKLEQMLAYHPDIVILTAGYNDRRYLFLTPSDSQKSFSRIAWLRKTVSVLQWSHVAYAILHEMGQKKLQRLRQHTLPLDQVKVRVPLDVFQGELKRIVSICHQNGMQLIFFIILQNPSVFDLPEKAFTLLQEEHPQQAIDLLLDALPRMHVAARPFAHLILGQGYDRLGNTSQAKIHYGDHEPVGSLHGEAVLRSQRLYMDSIDDLSRSSSFTVLTSEQAIKHVNERRSCDALQTYLDEFEAQQWPLVDGAPYLARDHGKVTDLDNFYRGRFVDECHYDPAGHILMGWELADVVMNLQG